MLFRGAARLSLPLGPLAGRISGEDYDLQEPSDATSEWVDLLSGLLGGLQERLQAAASLPDRAVHQVGVLSIPTADVWYLDSMRGVKAAAVSGRGSLSIVMAVSAMLQAATQRFKAVKVVGAAGPTHGR